MKDIAIPVLGKKKMSEISRQDVLDVLKPIWMTRNETASRLRGRLENIFAYAVSDGLMAYNPALWRGNLDRELPPPSKVQNAGHLEAMPLKELQEKIHCFLPPKNRTRQVILFTILTASRVGESAPARWDEIDWENKIWSVPPERRKDQKKYPHRVPLSRQAIELLKGIERKGDLIFCIDASNQGSKYSLRPLLQRMTGTKATMHGFRSTFRDWAAENGVPDTVAEKCLMHTTGNAVVQAYQRSDLLEQRREVMQAWADAVFEKYKEL
ncbi:tyrosine-type recombinase/integrase [Parasutterella muris]|uniref:tyrosine-type recombinase/integrase n=1 Tax=Parasutterella muris TaxID=2565572 RepID=UPI00353103B2